MLRTLFGWMVLFGMVPVCHAAAIEPVDAEPDRAADFYVDVYPVLEAKCLACHNRRNKESDLVLEDLKSILKGGASGEAVVPGKPDESLLYKVCAHLEDPVMPPPANKAGAAPLTPKELGRLRRWIAEGAKQGESNPSAAAIGWQAVPESMKASYALSLSPNQRFVATSRANAIHIIDLLTRTRVDALADPLIRTVQSPNGQPLYDRDVSHLDLVQALAFSPDGEWLASGGYREVKLWKRSSSVVSNRLTLDAAIKALGTSGDVSAPFLVSLADGRIELRDQEAGEKVSSIGTVADVTRLVVAADASVAAGATDAGQITIWRLADQKVLAQFPAAQPVMVLALADAGKALLTGHADGSIRQWAIPAEPVDQPLMPAYEVAATGQACLQLLVSEDGKTVAAAFADGRVVSVDRTSREVKETARFPAAVSAVELVAGTWSAGITAGGKQARIQQAGKPDGFDLTSDPARARVIATLEADKTVADSQQALAAAATAAADKEVTERTEAQTKAVKAKEDADKALTEAQAKVTELEAALAKAKEALTATPEAEPAKKAVTDAEAALKAPNEALAKAKEAVTAAERNVKFSEQATEATKKEAEARKTHQTACEKKQADLTAALAAAKEALAATTVEIRALRVSPDRNFIATGHSDGQIHLWSTATGRWLETLTGESEAIASLQWLDATTLVSRAGEKVVTTWNLQPQWKLTTVLGSTTGNRLDVSQSPITDRVLCVAFSPDGKSLASGGGEPSRGGELIIWDLETGKPRLELRELHSDTVCSLAFSRDGKFLASGSSDKFIKVSEVETGKFVRGYEGHTGHVLGVTWKADSSSLTSVGADGAVKIWNVETGEQRKSINASPSPINSLAQIGLGEQFVIGNSKGQSQHYEGVSGKVLKTFSGATGYVYGVATSPDGARLFSTGEDGIVRQWSMSAGTVEVDFKP